VTFLIMELVEGEDLSERISRGGIPVEEAVPIAMQIAEALEAAHEQGIVHRDLKPANIKLTEDGTVKVLDFGLAKAWEPGADGSGVNESPTLTAHATAAGVILGTASYMSPEQARGKKVDRRADIWAFGVVLWEMLTGQKLFEGETVSDVLAAVLTRETDLSALPSGAPASLERLLRRCLERDPQQRLRDAGDARLELAAAMTEGSRIDSKPVPSSRPWVSRAFAAFGAVALVLAGLVAMRGEESATPDSPLMKFHLPPPENAEFQLDLLGPGPPMLCPDGSQVLFTARGTDGLIQVWVRRFDELEPVRVPGTESAQYPFWSPDGRSIGFFSRRDGMLRRVDLESGRVLNLAEAQNGKGGTWNRDDIVVFTPTATSPLMRIAADGGDAVAVTALGGEGDFNSHRHPSFLEDGNRFLYVARSGSNVEQRQVRMGSLDGSVDVELTRSVAAAAVVDDFLFVLEGSSLVARPFDADAAAVGDPVATLVTDVTELEGAAKAVFHVAEDKLVALQRSDPTTRELRWYGEVEGGDPWVNFDWRGGFLSFALSPSGRMVVISQGDPVVGTQDLWLLDTVSGFASRLTSDPGEDYWPCWSPDNRTVFFGSNRGKENRNADKYSIYRMPVDRSKRAELVASAEATVFPSSVSADGRWLTVYTSDTESTDILAVDLENGGDPITVLDSDFNETAAALSPRARWMAYVSDESGRPEVYLTAFPKPGNVVPLSRDGGLWPFWMADGAIVYQDLDGRVLEVDLELDGALPKIKSSREIIDLPWVDRNYPLFGIVDDRSRVLSYDFQNHSPAPLTVISGWRQLVKIAGEGR
jgi:Tol biopolymer transport system component